MQCYNLGPMWILVTWKTRGFGPISHWTPGHVVPVYGCGPYGCTWAHPRSSKRVLKTSNLIDSDLWKQAPYKPSLKLRIGIILYFINKLALFMHGPTVLLEIWVCTKVSRLVVNGSSTVKTIVVLIITINPD